ncbi:MAG: BlaI/MecI/CopY family transcriptional regulator [Gammaproteobacteria bacterium]|nr:BlaI/MecI/CopY family transcriptional regulator [Gammaproteobacteria bacterium]
MAKRPDGALEHDIMAVLWAADGPLPPGEIKDRLESTLAYTSVATVLGRLHAKGLVERTESGRAFAYRAAIDESQLAVRRIGAVLDSASDKAQVLAGFLGGLSKKDIQAVRALLGEERA